LAKQLSSGRFLTVGSGDNHKSMAYVGNIVAYLATILEDDTPYSLVNYADKPDLSTNELVTILRNALNQHHGQTIHLPLWLGILGGYGFDLVARVAHREFSISSIRVKKFAADTIVNTRLLDETGFKRPFTIQEGLMRTIAAEFPSQR
jgi:nucleoside-diphosphate-sugar epimerase